MQGLVNLVISINTYKQRLHSASAIRHRRRSPSSVSLRSATTLGEDGNFKLVSNISGAAWQW